MSTKYIGPGEVVSYVNAGAAIASNAVVTFGSATDGFIGVAMADIPVSTAADPVGPVRIEGVFELAATTADAWVQGDVLWWDTNTSKLTDVNVATYGFFAGIAMDTKVATTQTTARVKLSGGIHAA